MEKSISLTPRLSNSVVEFQWVYWDSLGCPGTPFSFPYGIQGREGDGNRRLYTLEVHVGVDVRGGVDI